MAIAMCNFQQAVYNIANVEVCDILVSRKRKSNGIVGKTIVHKAYGRGKITKYDRKIITVKFEREGVKTFNYQLCMEKQLIQVEQ
jgi:hypothetical protein